MIKGKKLGLVVLVLFSFFIFINIIEPSIFSKFVFTMKAVSNSFSVSLTINSGIAPNITIYEPKSRVYAFGKNMMLGYRVVDEGTVNSIWFNLNNGSNTTLNANGYVYYFNASLGNNTLYVFANDTQGNLNNSVFVNFTIGKYEGSGYEINDSGGFAFNDDTINEYFKGITGLNSSWTLNITMYGNNTPSDWIRPNIVENEVLYFEMSANAFGDTYGDYNFYFNLSRALLSEIDPGNIRVYFYNNNWNELTTTVQSSNSNAVEFMAALIHLSQFMIGEKEGGSSSSSSSSPGGESNDRRAVYPIPNEKINNKPGEIKKPEEKSVVRPGPEGNLDIPKSELGAGISFNNILSISLLLISLILVITFLSHKGYIYKNSRSKSYVKLIKFRHSFIKSSKMVILLLFLLLLIIYLLGSNLVGVTADVVKNVGSSSDSLLFITILMLIISVTYFYKKIYIKILK